MGQEAGVGAYDALHETVESDGGARARAIYAPLFRAMLGLVAASGAKSVLEVGCGSGLFAELLVRNTAIAYRGFDFSPAGVALARARVKQAEFFVGNALSAESYRGAYGCIVCAEVLEHIHDDRDVVGLWPSGTHFVCSVPNFDYPTHVRHFQSEQAVRERYGAVLDIHTIRRVTASPFAGRSAREYAQRLIWARTEPRKLLGLLGINAFEWNAGWFVFAGRCR
ncbi:MAG TPA: methyltransferase domain-containing protein [Acetobacteraceae bacterium]|nr:methyltransferase domain-containing protein [Acetobacteraceae bacterium]